MRKVQLPAAQSSITFLYPGAGTDTNVLELGVQLLYDTPLDHARFIFTDIGEWEGMDDSNVEHWHEGRMDALREIEKNLSKNKPAMIKRIHQRRDRTTGWENSFVPNSFVTRYDLPVSTPQGLKRITLYFAYNTFEDRQEVTAAEEFFFTPGLLVNARRAYWPVEIQEGKVYPTYFVPAQFAAADVIISKKCGDIGLLQFDYVRAFHRTTVVKPRVIIGESLGLNEVVASLAQFNTQRFTAVPDSMVGYCNGGYNRDPYTHEPIECNLDLLIVS